MSRSHRQPPKAEAAQRRVDLARVIKTRFNVILAERSIGAMLADAEGEWLRLEILREETGR
jgi:hypothetical protein